MSEFDPPQAYHANRSKTLQEPVFRQDQDVFFEPATPGYNKLFVLSAIVVFLSFAFHSLPNVISANHPGADSAKSGPERYKEGSSADQGPGASLDRTLKSTTKAPFKGIMKVALGMIDNTVGEIDNDQQEKQGGIHNTDHASLSQHTLGWVQVSPSMKASPTSPPEKQQQQQQQQEQIDFWSLARASTSLGVGLCLWFLGTMYQSARFVVATPIEVAAAMVERPYHITRDICKAFMPVYSFFSVAAMIGIVVGGMESYEVWSSFFR